jgi:hypothetical protein
MVVNRTYLTSAVVLRNLDSRGRIEPRLRGFEGTVATSRGAHVSIDFNPVAYDQERRKRGLASSKIPRRSRPGLVFENSLEVTFVETVAPPPTACLATPTVS